MRHPPRHAPLFDPAAFGAVKGASVGPEFTDLARVVITGMGWVTPLGCDVDSVWSKLLAGAAGFGKVTRFDASTFATDFASEIRGFDLAHFLDKDAADFADVNLTTKYALAAAEQAWIQSGLSAATLRSPERFGMYLGCGEGVVDFDAFSKVHVAAWDNEKRSLNAKAWWDAAERYFDDRVEVEQEPNMALPHLAKRFGCRGPASNCMTACAAGTQSVGEAFEILRHGEADVMFAGAAHSMIHPLGMTGFVRLTAMSTRRDDPLSASRPFSRTRDGFVMGEGAGMLVLETLEHALARGAKPVAEVVGYGSSADAYRITDMDAKGGGPRLAMTHALKEAGIDPQALGDDGRPLVHYISAHGTSTHENDSTETKAIRDLFGPLANRVPVSSVKSMLGHLIQAAGVVELITCVQAIRTGWVPPTINLHDQDPACDLDYIPNTARDLKPAGGVKVAMSNGFGFGGQNDAVVLREFKA